MSCMALVKMRLIDEVDTLWLEVFLEFGEHLFGDGASHDGLPLLEA